ncbi:phosphoglycerate kinase [Candidatus Kaiserbacteria bacterium]|nr:MAG: phosphoglycerate kinase [Candidatus Kaiserbacteria bacterium]
MNISWLDDTVDVAGKVVLVRAGLNVPIQDGIVQNDFRIRKALPTLEFLRERGAKIVVIAHIGRERNETLEPVARALNEYIPTTFVQRETLDASALVAGEVVLVENMRTDVREIENDDVFAKEIAEIADLFVQDAFAVLHREHASIIGVPKYLPSYGGLLLREEINALTHAQSPKHPALFILGGAKFATKEPLIRKYLEAYDSVFVGGALANEFLAAQGVAVGVSVIEDGKVPADILENTKIAPVTDVVVASEGGGITKSIHEVALDEKIVDIGPDTMKELISTLPQYKSIVWNGPFGWYEGGYDKATVALAQALARTDAHIIIGGGDTVAIVQQEGLENEFDFVSTGGGAMLEFLLKGTLPGLEALSN